MVMRCRSIFAVFVCCAGLIGCHDRAIPEPKSGAPAAGASVAQTPDFASFDRLITPEAVFPNAAQRSLYRMQPPVTENAQRTYTFHLAEKPGMDAARHFDIVTITWARAGTLVKSRDTAPSGVGGPGGGFIDAYAQTEDRAYDVRVSRGMLLPNAVEVPPFDVEQTANNMVRLYQAQRSAK